MSPVRVRVCEPDGVRRSYRLRQFVRLRKEVQPWVLSAVVSGRRSRRECTRWGWSSFRSAPGAARQVSDKRPKGSEAPVRAFLVGMSHPWCTDVCYRVMLIRRRWRSQFNLSSTGDEGSETRSVEHESQCSNVRFGETEPKSGKRSEPAVLTP